MRLVWVIRRVCFGIKLVLGLFLCMSATGAEAKKAVDFKILDRLVPGQITKVQVQELLGSPSDVTDFQKLPQLKDRKDLGELWEYSEGEHTRLSIFFLSGSDSLYSWTWHAPSGDLEQKLRTAMTQYAPLSEWEPETDKWINPHSYPNDCYFQNKKLSMSIEYNRARKEVFTITRSDSSRKPASDENEKPPTFCIQSACSPAIPAKEFFKDFPISKYCEIPK